MGSEEASSVSDLCAGGLTVISQPTSFPRDAPSATVHTHDTALVRPLQQRDPACYIADPCVLTKKGTNLYAAASSLSG
jgi:hypothetical protein